MSTLEEVATLRACVSPLLLGFWRIGLSAAAA
jgi:hypothetical protein